MYVRFLQEAAKIAGDRKRGNASVQIDRSGRMFSEIGQMFINFEDKTRVSGRIAKASEIFRRISDTEEQAFRSIA
ncbi:MAG: hypothetical protein A4E28_01298 [Methanocella sp. PtaU1.Bin125]|nr:MAG: hypothetical protein A4E28_01298 [Methanocella sp. PtaU1.Bin125]